MIKANTTQAINTTDEQIAMHHDYNKNFVYCCNVINNIVIRDLNFYGVVFSIKS